MNCGEDRTSLQRKDLDDYPDFWWLRSRTKSQAYFGRYALMVAEAAVTGNINRTRIDDYSSGIIPACII